MRNVHRILSVLACALMLYLGVTGSLMQLLDLSQLAIRAPETAPGMQSINEGKNGNPDYAVVSVSDYTAAPLPKDIDVEKAIRTVLQGLHRLEPGDRPTFVELRVANGKVIGQARYGQMPGDLGLYNDGIKAVDATSGAAVPEVNVSPMMPAPSLRETLKEWHRFWSRNDVPGVFAELLSGIILWVLIVTGLVMYFRLLKQRRKIGRSQLFWMTNDRWRGLHRIISVLAAALLIVVAFSGTWLGFESVWRHFEGRFPPTVFAPLSDAQVLQIGNATMAALHEQQSAVPIRAIRVRDYAGIQQGVAVTDELVTRQLVYDAATGRQMGLTEPGYPKSGFPFGLVTHEFIKHLHSGFLFGLWARLFDLVAGLALVFLSASGFVMYLEMYGKRRRAGRSAFFWK